MFKQLQDMALFALVAEMGSFTAAAQKAELPKSSVSQRISQLEQQVGIRLLNRTTRRISHSAAARKPQRTAEDHLSGRDWRDAAGAYECRVPASLP